MLRNLAAALALTLLSQIALGLGLGTLMQSSGLNEPFSGRVGILGATASDLDTILVKLAEADQFERAGVSRDAVLLQLQFKVVRSSSDEDYIQVSSSDPIREPFLNFLLELDWAKGRIVREYTALLDPPLYDPVRRSAPVASAAPTPKIAEPLAEPTPTPMIEQVTSSISDTAMESVAGYDEGGRLAPVEFNDTLWALASANLADNTASVQQMMLALLRANPDAFGRNNINILKRGSILRLPDASELATMSQAEALAEVQRHHQLWGNYRDAATEDVDIMAPEARTDIEEQVDTMSNMDYALDDEPMSDAGSATSDENDARLELVAPQGEGDEMGGGADAEGFADITLAREELDAQVQENNELQARILEANEIIDLMSRQVDIKDDEFAALQARLVELGIEGSVPAVDETMATLPDEGGTELSAIVDPVVDEETSEAKELQDVDITIIDDPAVAAAGEADGAQMTLPSEQDMAMKDGVAAADEQLGGLLSGFIPTHIQKLVPGGAMTIAGLIGIVLLGIVGLLFKLFRRGGDGDDEHLSVVAAAASDEDMTALTEGSDDELITETREDEAGVLPDEFSSEDTIEITPEMQRTLETSADELAAQQSDEDPLEEVNVYLAYERFEQAEELVRNVIAEHPDEHNYKLRLLEVFYSANDKIAYEEAAQVLLESVGEDDPLWESTVAMWTELSPEHALFEERAELAASTDVDAGDSSGFVDITADDDVGADTISMAPGANGVLDSTQIGFSGTADLDENDDGDLDLIALDLDGEADGFLDLTATTEALGDDDGEALDLTAGMDESAESEEPDILDFISELEQSWDDDDVLDITSAGSAAAEDDLLDITANDQGAELDLLDVIKNDAAGFDQPEDILNVTSPVVAAAHVLNFDIAEFESEDALDSNSNDETLDISEGLDFNESIDKTVPALDLSIPLNTEIVSSDDIEMVEMEEIQTLSSSDTVDVENDLTLADDVDFDFSLQSPDFDDLSVADDAPGDADLELSGELEIEFELAVEDTIEMDSVLIEDTLELPQSDAPDESLEDLAKAMEESMADLDIGSTDLDISIDDLEGSDSEFDLNLTDTSQGLDIDFSDAEPGLDFDLEGFDLEDMEQEDTEEVDTKLNLAKAYIELGDKDGARSIIDEVARDGTPAQKAEAERLAEQLG
jgi:pilus assembly protein FimV